MLKTQLDNTSLLLEASRGGGVLSIIRDYSTLVTFYKVTSPVKLAR